MASERAAIADCFSVRYSRKLPRYQLPIVEHSVRSVNSSEPKRNIARYRYISSGYIALGQSARSPLRSLSIRLFCARSNLAIA